MKRMLSLGGILLLTGCTYYTYGYPHPYYGYPGYSRLPPGAPNPGSPNPPSTRYPQGDAAPISPYQGYAAPNLTYPQDSSQPLQGYAVPPPEGYTATPLSPPSQSDQPIVLNPPVKDDQPNLLTPLPPSRSQIPQAYPPLQDHSHDPTLVPRQ